MWYKEKPDGTKDQIITAHFDSGELGEAPYLHTETGFFINTFTAINFPFSHSEKCFYSLTLNGKW